jgi:hypothetical protein
MSYMPCHGRSFSTAGCAKATHAREGVGQPKGMSIPPIPQDCLGVESWCFCFRRRLAFPEFHVLWKASRAGMASLNKLPELFFGFKPTSAKAASCRA